VIGPIERGKLIGHEAADRFSGTAIVGAFCPAANRHANGWFGRELTLVAMHRNGVSWSRGDTDVGIYAASLGIRRSIKPKNRRRDFCKHRVLRVRATTEGDNGQPEMS
jgi:hypothetical protein